MNGSKKHKPEDSKESLLHELETTVLDRSLSKEQKKAKITKLEEKAVGMRGITLTAILEAERIIENPRLSRTQKLAELRELRKVFVGGGLLSIHNKRYLSRGFNQIVAKYMAQSLGRKQQGLAARRSKSLERTKRVRANKRRK